MAREFYKRLSIVISLVLVTVLLIVLGNMSFAGAAETDGSVSPASGPRAGGNAVTLRGSDFMGLPKQSAGKLVDVAAGVSHFVGITDQGRLYSWGDNSRGQLGSGDRNAYDPAYDLTGQLINPDDLTVETPAAVSASASATFVLTQTGRVYWWGNDVLSPTKMTGLHGQTVTKIVADSRDTPSVLLLTDRGMVYYWKMGTHDNVATIVSGFNLADPVKLINISPLRDSMIAVTRNNQIYTWTSATVPTKVDYLTLNDDNDPEGIKGDIISAVAGQNDNSTGEIQYHMVATREWIYSWDNVDSARVWPKPDTSTIQQVANDGLSGHFVLSSADRAYIRYAPIADNDYQEMAQLGEGERIERVMPYIADRSSGQLLALTDNGRVYLIGQTMVADLTPELYFTAPDAVEQSLIKQVKFGDQSAEFQVVDTGTITVTVPASANAEIVTVTVTDIYGNEYELGEYEYRAPDVMDGGKLPDAPDDPNPFDGQDDKNDDDDSFTSGKTNLDKVRGARGTDIEAPNTGVLS